ncbi:MAG: hypothetical protein JWQ71_2123 [Pedosphaera sp.]|nr:hypothetical protein [Pedosphaera sp.]
MSMPMLMALVPSWEAVSAGDASLAQTASHAGSPLQVGNNVIRVV